MKNNKSVYEYPKLPKFDLDWTGCCEKDEA